MKKIVVGLIGSGFVSKLHMEGYKKVYGADVQVKAVVARTQQTREAFAAAYGIKDTYDDYKEMLKDSEIDVVDICTPPHLHEEMIVAAMAAGKHVICEKPLTGFFNDGGDGVGNVGEAVPKADMYKKVLERLGRLKSVIDGASSTFMYAENWIYAPVVQKSARLIEAKKSKILMMHAEESHCGSHAAHAANWKYTGGGVLIRQGCHPLSAVLYLKQVEASARGEAITPESVIADCGVCSAVVKGGERKHLDLNPVDVEDIANVTITFSDGTKAHIMSGDMIVGGIRNVIDIYTNNSRHHCKLNPNDTMMSYHGDDLGLNDVYFTEKVGTKQGWQFLSIDEEAARGYVGELQDFVDCMVNSRQPLSDFTIAYDTAKIVYAAYQSAQENRRVYL